MFRLLSPTLVEGNIRFTPWLGSMVVMAGRSYQHSDALGSAVD
jgi:hypothetical protein